MSGSMAQFQAITAKAYAEAEQRLGEVRALRLAGHNNIFPTLSWLNGTARSASGIRAALIKLKCGRSVLLTKPPPMKLKPLLKTAPLVLLVLLVFSSRMTRRTGVKSRNCLKATAPATAKLCLEMGLGQEKRRDDGIPGITNYIFSETAARGMYQRWADLLSSESWQEVLDKTAAYQQEVMK